MHNCFSHGNELSSVAIQPPGLSGKTSLALQLSTAATN